MDRVLLYGLILIIAVSGTVSAFADPNTITKYCLKGTCSTGIVKTPYANYSHSVTKLPVLLISLSGTCETMNKQGLADCPSVKDLMKYDTSNQNISGKFVSHNGIYTRTPPQVKNNWIIYAHSTKPVVCVECTFDILASNQAKQIIIQPKDFTFVNKTAIVSKNMWVSWQGRYMQGCDVATIGNRPGLLNDTISYMLSGCKTTSFNGTQTSIIPDKPWEYNNPYSTLHQLTYLKNILHSHLTNTNQTGGGYGPVDCIRKTCDYTDPYKKIGW